MFLMTIDLTDVTPVAEEQDALAVLGWLDFVVLMTLITLIMLPYLINFPTLKCMRTSKQESLRVTFLQQL